MVLHVPSTMPRGRTAADRQSAHTGCAGGVVGGRRCRQTDGQAPGANGASQVHFFVARVKEVPHGQARAQWLLLCVGQGADGADRRTDSGSSRQHGWDAPQKDGQKLEADTASPGFRQQIQQARQMVMDQTPSLTQAAWKDRRTWAWWWGNTGERVEQTAGDVVPLNRRMNTGTVFWMPDVWFRP